MAQQILKNNCTSVLSSAVATGATTIALLDASIWPALTNGDWALATLIGLNANGDEATWEIVKVTGKIGNSVNVVRAQEGTAAKAWPQGTVLQMRLTAGGVATASLVDVVRIALEDLISKRVLSVAGKVLSSNDYTNEERVKLTNIATSATKNATDAELRDRATHTGVQSVTTISGLESQTAAGILSAVNMAATYSIIPTTNQGPMIIVTSPHLRFMVWNGSKYIRAPWHMPGEMFYSLLSPANMPHAIQVRGDVNYAAADHPDLAPFFVIGNATTFTLTDARGRVLRTPDNGRGIDTSLISGSLQEDAIRNFTGSLTIVSGVSVFEPVHGVFRGSNIGMYSYLSAATGSETNYPRTVTMDPSIQVPTAGENRVKSLVANLYITR